MPRAIQWLVFLGLLLVALVPWTVRRGAATRRAALGVALLGLCGLGAGIAWDLRLAREIHNDARLQAMVPHEGHPGGYVTSDQCRSCHPDQYESWHRSYHRTMTTVATTETIKAKGLPATLQLDGVTYRVERRGDEFWVEMPELAAGSRPGSPPSEGATKPRTWRRLTLITGSHHMQVFWVAGDEGNLQHLFPFSWLIEEQSWVPTRDTFLRDPAKGHPFQHWNLNCVRCHVTAGQPRPDAAYRDFDTRVGELGIACEACHGPADRHVESERNPVRRYASHLLGPGQAGIVNPRTQPKLLSGQLCGQCHGIRWIPAAENVDQNGFSYRPGDDLDHSTPVVHPARLDLQPYLKEPLKRNPSFLDEHFWSDGEVRVSGREFNGMMDSPCYERGDMTCLSCHSLHSYQSTDDQLAIGRDGDEACLQCHTQLRQDLTAHTHHPPGSSGSACYNCHMPHTTYGLLKAIRSHRISSPKVAADLSTGRPNACNLCHLDRSLGWTADTLERWYGQAVPTLSEDQRRLSAAVDYSLRGDAGQRALVAWHMGWSAAQQASGNAWVAPYLGQLLDDPYAAVRRVARRSLRRLPGFDDLSFDESAPMAEASAARKRVWDRWQERPLPRVTGEQTGALLLEPDGRLDVARFQALVNQRNNRSMDLQE